MVDGGVVDDDRLGVAWGVGDGADEKRIANGRETR